MKKSLVILSLEVLFDASPRTHLLPSRTAYGTVAENDQAWAEYWAVAKDDKVVPTWETWLSNMLTGQDTILLISPRAEYHRSDVTAMLLENVSAFKGLTELPPNCDLLLRTEGLTHSESRQVLFDHIYQSMYSPRIAVVRNSGLETALRREYGIAVWNANRVNCAMLGQSGQNLVQGIK